MKLSIITINFNDKIGLQKTIESVVSQTFHDFEYIVIDGGSTDGSVDVIRNHESNIAYWVSEKDTGIYNAMNKGLYRANGEYCLFLNSGDFLFNEHILMELFKYDFKEDIVSAGCTNFNEKEEWIKYPPFDVSLYTFVGGSLPHPSSLIKTSLLKELGGYRENYKIISDWCFFLEATIVHNCSYRAIELVLTRFNCYGVSSVSQNKEGEEKKVFLQRLFPRIIQDYSVLENEAFANVLFHFKKKDTRLYTLLSAVVLFPFKVVNRLLTLRRRLGKRMRIMKTYKIR